MGKTQPLLLVYNEGNERADQSTLFWEGALVLVRNMRENALPLFNFQVKHKGFKTLVLQFLKPFFSDLGPETPKLSA